ncbi:hypothetical protein A9Q84_01105 [Halobacteriovorax marinus]|uniref:DUF4114 domain-containing protein n=1 Tax=Halobacteriovorax marinus TaxID=97084 RepID=A0A1Y5FCA1_9BACT|nr:hypothetical protein A9Q84_01105 [Halobacteriovorax marinus]
MLPEYKEIDESFLNSSQEAVFTLNEDAELYTTFLWEGAGFKNSFGLYTIDENENIQRQEIIKNASMRGSGGPLKIGDTFNLGTYSKDTTFGFYIKPNGFYRNHNEGHYFYTEEQRNIDGIKHTVSSYDEEEQKVVIGFEDLWNGGDKDYNDLIFSIFTTPITSMSEQTELLPNINSSQLLNQATGMVTMDVAKFAKVQSVENIVMYPLELNQQYNVNFKGRGDFRIESNCGVVITGEVTSLTNGYVDIETSHQLDESNYSIITPQAQTHNSLHYVDVFSHITNLYEITPGDFQGTVTITVSPY